MRNFSEYDTIFRIIILIILLSVLVAGILMAIFAEVATTVFNAGIILIAVGE